jgi:deazaflavin-dependent oxidoreductase (nitroreductase family)
MTKPRPNGLDKPITTKIIKGMSTAHTWLYKTSGGRLGRKWRVGSALRHGVPICLVTTIGRKSGEPRTVPLLHLPDGNRMILVASQGGLPTNPQWYGNIVANPKVEIRVGRTTRTMIAHTANPEQRAALWPKLVAAYSDFANYDAWTEREIPVIVCEPA